MSQQTLFGIGFKKKTSETTGDELKAAADARAAQEEKQRKQIAEAALAAKLAAEV